MFELGLTNEEALEIRNELHASAHMGELLLLLARQLRAYRETGRGSLSVFDAVSHVLADALGEDFLADLYGEVPPRDAPNSEHLKALADRLFPLSFLFTQEDKNNISSLSAAREELHAIAAGDAPRLFKAQEAIKGRPINAYRMATHQLRALAWEAFLKAQENSPSDTHLAIHQAFGVEWTTIARWKKQVVRELGQKRYERAMRDSARGLSPDIGIVRTTEEALAKLKIHGQQYQKELRSRVEPA